MRKAKCFLHSQDIIYLWKWVIEKRSLQNINFAIQLAPIYKSLFCAFQKKKEITFYDFFWNYDFDVDYVWIGNYDLCFVKKLISYLSF